MVTVPFPHLAGLAAAVRVSSTSACRPWACSRPAGWSPIPAFAARLKDNELVFVLAHELLHLALRTHDRASGSGRLEFNYAHDYIINDILRAELGVHDDPGRRPRHAGRARAVGRGDRARDAPQRRQMASRRTCGRASRSRCGGCSAAGAGEPQDRQDAGDVLADKPERECFPAEAAEQAERVKRMRELAAKSLALGRRRWARMKGRGRRRLGRPAQVVSALRGLYRTPWQMALQRWMESVAPGERTFARPSRRGAERADVVLPGRKREVLDAQRRARHLAAR